MAVGWLADLTFGDPRRGHPVALFGSGAAWLERGTYSDSRTAGAAHIAALLGGLAAVGVGLDRAAARHGPAATAAVTAVATFVALGGTTLVQTGAQMADLLEANDVDGARTQLPSLCGRDPAFLDSDGLARAALESVAENTSDAQVAPLCWGAVAGVPGLLVYRGSNTLDAMIGHHSERYERFGWAAARFDDVLNYLPARATGVLTAVSARVAGGTACGALAAWRRDAAKHPSPNAGVAEASFAGALGVQLGGTTRYAYRTEERPRLGAGRAPTASDLRRSVALSRAVQVLAAASAVAAAAAISGVSRTCRRVSPPR